MGQRVVSEWSVVLVIALKKRILENRLENKIILVLYQQDWKQHHQNEHALKKGAFLFEYPSSSKTGNRVTTVVSNYQ